jgi:hypothetical protein
MIVQISGLSQLSNPVIEEGKSSAPLYRRPKSFVSQGLFIKRGEGRSIGGPHLRMKL